jgi:hypothetical protein
MNMIQWYGWHSLSDEFSQQTSFETNIHNKNNDVCMWPMCQPPSTSIYLHGH